MPKEEERHSRLTFKELHWSRKMGRAKDYITICGWGLYIPEDEFREKLPDVTIFPGLNTHANVIIYGVRRFVFICDGVFKVDSQNETIAVIDPGEPSQDLLAFGREHFPTRTPQLMMISVYVS